MNEDQNFTRSLEPVPNLHSQGPARQRLPHPSTNAVNQGPSTHSLPPTPSAGAPGLKRLEMDEEDFNVRDHVTSRQIRPSGRPHADSFNSIQSEDSSYGDTMLQPGDRSDDGWIASWKSFSSSRLMTLSMILLVAIPLLCDMPLLGTSGPSIIGAKAGVVKRSEAQKKSLVDGKLMVPRANTDTDVCNRWSHQSALINGTVYIYGGRATTKATQTQNQWNNDFLTMDVAKSWDIGSPVISGLPRPSGPPPVSNGYLWHSYNSLFLYGGEYSDKPATTPSAYSMWEYNIASSSWIQHQNPKTSSGNNSDDGNKPVLGKAEGAGVSVPELGRGWYFGGHQDAFTTPGWSVQVERVYLKSLLEFTFPGYPNSGVQSLGGGKKAGTDGVWRNITEGGIQDTAKFSDRADSVLVYVPGYGPEGILVNMGGGNNESFVSIEQHNDPIDC